MALGDKRLKKYESSPWATVNTNIYNRPIFFNCYPDFFVDLSCPMTSEALKLDPHIQGGEFQVFAAKLPKWDEITILEAIVLEDA